MMRYEAPIQPEVWERAVARPELRQADRCDRCGAPAMERWENGVSEFCFCKHHANQYRRALSAAGWFVTEAWRFELTTREVVTEQEVKGPYGQVTKAKESDFIRGLTRVREV